MSAPIRKPNATDTFVRDSAFLWGTVLEDDRVFFAFNVADFATFDSGPVS